MSIRELRVRVMECYCMWWDCFTTNDNDTENKEGMYQAVYAMDSDELLDYLKFVHIN